MTAPEPVAPAAPPTAVRVLDLIGGYAMRWQNEADLQAALAELLAAEGLTATREVALSPGERIDLMVGRVGIEVKTSRQISREAVLAQLQRYARSDLVDELLLVTTRATHSTLPVLVGGKPLVVLWLRGVG